MTLRGLLSTGLGILAAGVVVMPAARAQPPPYVTQWGTPGSGNGQFDGPAGLGVDGGGNVFVADYGNHRVQKFTSTGVYLGQWGTQGSGPGQFNGPEGLAVDASGNVYVVDFGNHRVQKFDNAGAYLTQWGSFGAGVGQFAYPVGVTVDGVGNVYVADHLNSRIQKFTNVGDYLTRWGLPGSGDGQFAYPAGLAVDVGGNVYVGDTGNGGVHNNRIQKFTGAGAYLTQWGTQGSGDGQFGGPSFGGPWGVAVDPEGNVFVVDYGNHRVQKFTGTGTYLTQWGTQGSGNGQFLFPYSVATDAVGNVYVAEVGNNRIQKFGPPPTATQPSSWGRIKVLYR